MPGDYESSKEHGIEEASPIQAKAIPAMMEGKDIIGQAQTEQERRQHLEFPCWKR